MYKPLLWSLTGSVTEARELKSKEGKVFGHSVKVATVGATFDLRVPEWAFAQIGVGMVIQASGGVTLFNNNIQLAAAQLAAIELDEAGAPKGKPVPITDPKATKAGAGAR